MLVVYAPSVDGVLKDIELIGDAVGAADEAKTMTDGMSARQGDLDRRRGQGRRRGAAKPRVYYEIGYTDTTGQI